jgi:hypothetical protein
VALPLLELALVELLELALVELLELALVELLELALVELLELALVELLELALVELLELAPPAPLDELLAAPPVPPPLDGLQPASTAESRTEAMVRRRMVGLVAAAPRTFNVEFGPLACPTPSRLRHA